MSGRRGIRDQKKTFREAQALDIDWSSRKSAADELEARCADQASAP
jgi:hypothetical protein